MTDHIPDPSKKVLSPEQIRFMAEMYAEQNAIEIVIVEDYAYRVREGRVNLLIDFNDLNIIMGVAVRWRRGNSTRRLVLQITENGYQANALDVSLKSYPKVHVGKGVTPSIAIASALLEIKE